MKSFRTVTSNRQIYLSPPKIRKLYSIPKKIKQLKLKKLCFGVEWQNILLKIVVIVFFCFYCNDFRHRSIHCPRRIENQSKKVKKIALFVDLRDKRSSS